MRYQPLYQFNFNNPMENEQEVVLATTEETVAEETVDTEVEPVLE